MDKKQQIRVAVKGPFLAGLDYEINARCDDLIGRRVRVPLRNRDVVGVVVAYSDAEVKFKLKEVSEIIDETPLFNTLMMSFIQWVSDYYHYPIGDCFLTAMPKNLCQGKPFEIKNTRTKKLDTVETNESHEIELNDDQIKALSAIENKQNEFVVNLLEGVTGSGKTEIYLQAIDKVLKAGKQALVLVPEIGLTPQTISRFAARFDVEICLLHSEVSEGQKVNAWVKCNTGEVRILIGTRSALFAPFKELGMIIVDEEHDLSFKQQSTLRYNARDLVIKRAHLENIPVILGSATPSIESLSHALQDKYQHLQLLARPGTSSMPTQHLIDCRGKKLTGGLTPILIDKMRDHINAGNQVLLFINRRGFAPALMCKECGYLAGCTRCDTNMTLHRNPPHLCCHHCGRTAVIPNLCPQCEQLESMCDVGAGTEKIEAHLEQLFPAETIARIDRSNTAKKGELEALLTKVHSGEAKILVGTQMIAKGHHFAKVSMVGIINIDDGLASADFRSVERAGQLLTQVAGRSGRADIPGEVYIQTFQPEHPHLLTLLKEGYHTFADELIKERKSAHWPPFSYLALIHAESKSSEEANQFLLQLQHNLNAWGVNDVMILGPVPALLQKKAGFYRHHLLLQSSGRNDLHRALKMITTHLYQDKTSQVRWLLDVDPMELV